MRAFPDDVAGFHGIGEIVIRIPSGEFVPGKHRFGKVPDGGAQIVHDLPGFQFPLIGLKEEAGFPEAYRGDRRVNELQEQGDADDDGENSEQDGFE